MESLYWHDYETWGATPSVDRPSQFAGVRTDLDLNIVSDPTVLYCKSPPDVLPHPEACLVTGLLPQEVDKKGVNECEFIRRIHAEMSQANTCTVGYNSLRFDDEVTRYTLYRNFFDPYEREWRNGNSRWDIIDMVRLVYALRPGGIEWPVVDGKPRFKLELLTQANGISHGAAHDAYSDVEATINLARLIKDKKPALYDYAFSSRHKSKAASFIDIKSRKPLLHVSSKFSSDRGCLGIVAPIAMHPTNKNAVIVIELSQSVEALMDLSIEEIHRRVFTSASALAEEGNERLPVKLIHLNKCPILATPKLLDEQSASRLGIDKSSCEKHWQSLLSMDVAKKVQGIFTLNEFAERKDPEQALYSGFISNHDKSVGQSLRQCESSDFGNVEFAFEDSRLKAMLIRYKARNFPESLNSVERKEWLEFVENRLQFGDENILSCAQVSARIKTLLKDYSDDQNNLSLLRSLQEYIDEKSAEFGINPFEGSAVLS